MSLNPAFLSLPSPVKEKVVLYSAQGTRGYRSLLSLRCVCKTTNTWITELAPSSTRQIFSNNIVRLGATKNKIQEFVNSSFSSLHIPSLFFDVNPRAGYFNPYANAEDAALWEAFLALWAPRLESLELFDLPLPILPNLKELIECSRSLRSLQCASVSAGDDESPHLFNDFPFTLESIAVTRINLTFPQRAEFYRRLLSNVTNLKSFGTAPFYMLLRDPEHTPDFSETFRNLRQLVEAKQADPDFTLTLNLGRFPEITDDVQKGLLFDSLRSAIESASRIRLFCVDESLLIDGRNVLEGPQLQQFFNLIYSIKDLAEFGQTFERTEFPNLQYIQYITSPAIEESDLRLLRLNRLGIALKSPLADFTRILPQTLRTLKISNRNSTPVWLANTLNTISACCPGLLNLEIMCIIAKEQVLPGEDDVPVPPASLQQTSIKFFSFVGVFEDPEVGKVAGLTVVQAISNVPLKRLRLRFLHRVYVYQIIPVDFETRMVDLDILTVLQSPSIEGNLVYFNINEAGVVETAVPTLEEIKRSARRNARASLRTPVKRLSALEERGEAILDLLADIELW